MTLVYVAKALDMVTDLEKKMAMIFPMIQLVFFLIRLEAYTHLSRRYITTYYQVKKIGHI